MDLKASKKVSFCQNLMKKENNKATAISLPKNVSSQCRAPQQTAAAILHGLSELDRIHLLLALQTSTSRETLQKRDTDYVDDLVKIVKASPLHSGLTRGQIANAIAYQRMLQRYSSYSQKPPTAMQLGAVMLASGLPFLG